MNSPWQYFTMKELTCQCGCGRMEMDTTFMAIIVSIRRELGFPLWGTSGFRCQEHNNNISTTGFDGPHTTGKALDIIISYERAFLLMGSALRHGITGIGVKQKGPRLTRFIHLDSLESPRPRIWSY